MLTFSRIMLIAAADIFIVSIDDHPAILVFQLIDVICSKLKWLGTIPSAAAAVRGFTV